MHPGAQDVQVLGSDRAGSAVEHAVCIVGAYRELGIPPFRIVAVLDHELFVRKPLHHAHMVDHPARGRIQKILVGHGRKERVDLLRWETLRRSFPDPGRGRSDPGLRLLGCLGASNRNT